MIKRNLPEIIEFITGVDQKELKPSSVIDSIGLDSLGIDSLDKIEILMMIEDDHDIEISDDDALRFVTIKDVSDHMIEKGVHKKDIGI